MDIPKIVTLLFVFSVIASEMPGQIFTAAPIHFLPHNTAAERTWFVFNRNLTRQI
jgi:hypothetical protein